MVDFDLITLRLLNSAVRLGSISAAAEHHNIAVSAVSRRFSDLEHRLGTAVLYRKGKGVEATPAGEALLRHARNLLQLADRAVEEMAGFAQGSRGQVRLAANPSAVSQYLPQTFASFVADYPGIRIALSEAMSETIVADILDGVVDVGIFSSTVAHDGLEVFPFNADQLCVVVGEDHPLAGRASLRFADIVGEPHVALENGSSLFIFFSDLAAKSGTPLDVTVRVRSFEGVRQMVASGLGVAILPIGVVAPYLDIDGLAAVPLDEDWAERWLLAGVRERRALSVPAAQFLDHLLGPDASGD